MSRSLIIRYECARLIETWSLPIVALRPVRAEPMRKGADQRWFTLATQAIPVECHNGRVTQESNMFRAPVTVTDHALSDWVHLLSGARRNLVNPLGAFCSSGKIE